MNLAVLARHVHITYQNRHAVRVVIVVIVGDMWCPLLLITDACGGHSEH